MSHPEISCARRSTSRNTRRASWNFCEAISTEEMKKKKMKTKKKRGEKGHLSQKTLLRDPSGLGLDRANGVVWKTGCPGKGSAEHWRDESDREGAGEGKAINRAIEDRRCGRDMKEAVNSWTLLLHGERVHF